MRMLSFGTKYITEEYLRSKEYDELMLTFLTDDVDIWTLGQDLDMFKSYGFRHLNMGHVYSWRWLSIYQHREEIMEYVFSDKVGIDFGGGNGTIGGNTRIIDIQDGYDKIEDVEEESLDYIFTSHCLEHIVDLDDKLKVLLGKLKKGGKMLAILPSHRCRRWWAPKDLGMTDDWVRMDHKWTFSLEDGKFTRIDKKIEKAGFKIITAEYAWESAIWIVAEKNDDT